MKKETSHADEQVLNRIPERVVLFAYRQYGVVALQEPLVNFLHEETTIHELSNVPEPHVQILQVCHSYHDPD